MKPPTTLSLPHALDRFIERCPAIVCLRSWSACEALLRTLMTNMTYRLGTWDAGALDGLGQALYEVDFERFTVVGTVDGDGVLRTINACEE